MAISLSEDQQYILDSLSPTIETSNLINSTDLSDDQQYLLKALQPSFKSEDESITTGIGIDPNSTANKWDIATDQAGEMFYDGVALLAAKVGADDIATDFRKTSDEYKQSAASKPQPEISMSITEEAPKIYDKFSEGEILEAITDTADFVHSVLVGVAPSMLATGAAVGTAAVAKPVMLGIGAGAIASNLTAAVIGMTPSMLMSSGQVYEDALKYGASEEEAENIGIGAGSVVGALDRLGFTALLSGLTGKLGKETTIKAIKEQTDLSESMIREAVNKAVKQGGRGIKIEGATEAAQTIVEETSPALVSEKEVELANLVPKVIDSFAAGGIGGGFVGAMTGAISVPVARQAIKRAEEIDADIEKFSNEVDSQYDLNLERPDQPLAEAPRTVKEPGKKTKAGELPFEEDTEPLLFTEEELQRRDKENKQYEEEKIRQQEELSLSLGTGIGLTEASEKKSGVDMAADQVQKAFDRITELKEKRRGKGKPIKDDTKKDLNIEKGKISKIRLPELQAKKKELDKKLKGFRQKTYERTRKKSSTTPEEKEKIKLFEEKIKIENSIKDAKQDRSNIILVKKQVKKPSQLDKGTFTKEEAAELKQLEKQFNRRESQKASSFFRDIVSRSTTKLRELSNTVPIAGKMINDLMNIEFNNNEAIGKLFRTKELINDKIRKAYKLPFQSTISMDIKRQVSDQLSGRKEAVDPRAREVAIEIKREIFDRLYAVSKASGIEMGRVEEYLPRIYKFRMKGLGRSKDIAKFKKILNDNNLDGAEIVDNIITNDGVYMPSDMVDIFDGTDTDLNITSVARGTEKSRTITEEVARQLEDAGLVEKDFDKVTNKYIVDTIRRANLNRFVTEYKPVVNELYKSGLMTESEGKRIKNIVDGLQSRYKPIKNLGIRSLYRFTNSLAYILTLPLAGITALTEPLIVLHRVNPKNAIYGLMDASIIGLRKGVRAFAPQFKRSENEQALLSLMQTADLALVDSQRDIGDIAVSKKITDKFFRVNMLAQVTQFSRYIAYQAGKRQMNDDIKLIQKEQLDGNPTDQSRSARKRLMIEGLGTLIPRVNQKTDTVEKPTPEQQEILNWFNEGMDEATTPQIITRALGKLVDEVIMTPNVVNKPLWMSNPYLAPVAQLKGFMMVFGNTVGMRMYKDVFQPLYKGRVPAGEIAKYAMTFTLLSSAIMGTQVIKNAIRYGDDESPYDKLEGWEKLWAAIKSSNIFGFGNVFVDALNSQKYGQDPITSFLGPAASKISGLVKALGSGSPQRIATAFANITPGLSSVSAGTRKNVTEPVAEFIGDIID